MQVLTVDESASWLKARGLQLNAGLQPGSDHHLEIPDRFHRLQFLTPQRPQDQVSLAHLLTEWFACESAFLLINVVALFQPHELDAFLFLRRYYGDTRWVDSVPGGETPGHLFGDGLRDDRRNVREHMMIMQAYTFEGYFVQNDGAVVLWVADEVIDIAAVELASLERPREIIHRLDLRVVA